MSGAYDARHFVFVPIDVITTPIPGTPRVIVDYHWLVDAGDKVAFFNPVDGRGRRTERYRLGSMQANADERVGAKVAPHYPWCVGVRQIPVAFIPEDLSRIAALMAASTPTTTTAAPTAETGA